MSVGSVTADLYTAPVDLEACTAGGGEIDDKVVRILSVLFGSNPCVSLGEDL